MLAGIRHPRLDVSASVLVQMLRYLASLGVDTGEFLASGGLDPGVAGRPDERIPMETYLFLEEEAARVTGDDHFGLHMGQFVEPGSWSILGYLMMNCANVGESFAKAGKYSRIIGNLIQGRGGLHRGALKLILSVPSYAPRMSRHCYETVLSGSVRMMRALSGKEIHPLEVAFGYPAPAPVAEYERIFRCPVHFSRRETSMLLDPKILGVPVLHPDSVMLAHFEAYARSFMEGLEGDDSTVRAVTRILLSSMDAPNLSIWTVAKELHLGVRTLQGRLAEEGVSFSALLRETRAALAKKYLKENYTVEDITYLLGFSDPSVFRKAFKKWSGVTPKEYRAGAS